MAGCHTSSSKNWTNWGYYECIDSYSNTQISVTREGSYSTIFHNQDSILIDAYEGESLISNTIIFSANLF
jgi:hypothetical protein